jgi:hypothetical protein
LRLQRNDSGLPDDEVRAILACAARGVRDVGIQVVLRRGAWPGVRCLAESLVLVCRPPAENRFYVGGPMWVGHWVARRFPGLLDETLADQIVWLAAMGFNALKARRRQGVTGDPLHERRRRARNTAQVFAFRRLNAWRVLTGRESVPETRGADNGALALHNLERKRQAQQRALARRVAVSPLPLGRFVMLGGPA